MNTENYSIIILYFIACETIVVTSDDGVRKKRPEIMGAYVLQNGIQNNKYFWKEKYGVPDEKNLMWWYADHEKNYWMVRKYL